MDLCFARLKKSSVDLGKVVGISGAGQQHGTVYLNATGLEKLADLSWDKSLADQFADGFSRKTSPIWMDTSTSSQCREIEAAVGGPLEVCVKSGSIAIERFSGPQIRRFYQIDPAGYKGTRRIHLVSSFIGSLLAGTYSPIEFGMERA